MTINTETPMNETATHIEALYLPVPINPTTGKAYQNSNRDKLLFAFTKKGYITNEWATMRQWNGQNERVAKDEKGTRIVFYKNEIVKGKPVKALKQFFVFNRCQLENFKQVKDNA